MLTLRPAQSAEAERLARIGLSAWEKAVATWGEDLDKLRMNAERAYAEFCARAWPDIVVADWDGQAVGWGASENADDTISDLWVLPEFQRRGVGTALMAELENQIIGRGHRVAKISTHARNAEAIRLYKELGYQVVTYAVTYSDSLDTDIDKVEMVKHFGEEEDEVSAGHDDGLYDPLSR